MPSFQEKVSGVVYSTALGDALGAPIEKLSYQEIKERFGRVESLKTEWYKTNSQETMGKKRGNGITTDDTLLTIVLINLFIKEKRHLDAYDMGNGFAKKIAFEPTYIPEFDKKAMIIDRLFYPEKYIYLRHVLANCEPREGGLGNMVNCGAAMYISPIGVVNAGNPKAAYDEAILFAMGHQNSYGLEAAGVLAACVAKAFEPDVIVDDIIETALMLAKDGTRMAIEELTAAARELKARTAEMDEVIEVFTAILAVYSPMRDDVNRNSEKLGIPSNHYTPSRLFSIEELPMALAFIVLNNGEYYRSIYDGVNSGRDTDSIGVMIGVILGAMYGDSVIRESDKQLLELRNKTNYKEVAEQFASVAESIIKQDILENEKRRKLF